MIDPRALLDGRQDAERHRDRDRQDQAQQRQLGGCGQAAGDLGHNRPSGGQRVAEIAMREIVDVADELLAQRPVETETDANLLDRFLGRGRPSLPAEDTTSACRHPKLLDSQTPDDHHTRSNSA